jgi:hypothetical protein
MVTPSIRKGAVPVQTSALGFAKVIEGILLIVNLISATASREQGVFAGAVKLSITKPLSISAVLGVNVGDSVFPPIKEATVPDMSDQVTVPPILLASAPVTVKFSPSQIVASNPAFAVVCVTIVTLVVTASVGVSQDPSA